MSSKQVPDHDGGVVGKAISPQTQDALVNFCMQYFFFSQVQDRSSVNLENLEYFRSSRCMIK